LDDALGVGAADFRGAFHVVAFFATAVVAFPGPPPLTFPHPEENITVTIPARMVIPTYLRMRSKSTRQSGESPEKLLTFY
jgi:hypothetical protein